MKTKKYLFWLKFVTVAFLFFMQIGTKAQCLVSQISINTGYDPVTSTVITPGATDPYWTVTGLTPSLGTFGTAYPANVISSFTAAPWATNANSNWISYANTNTPTMDPAGPWYWTVERTFTTCSKDDISFDFFIANDDYIQVLKVDGTTMYSQSPSANWSGYTSVSFIISGLAPGLHTISIEQADLPGQTAMGLDIYGTVSSSNLNNSIVSDGCRSYSCSPCNFTYCYNASSPQDYIFQPTSSSIGNTYQWFENGVFIGNSTGSFNYTLSSPGTFDIEMREIDNTNALVCSIHHEVCTGTVRAHINGGCISDYTVCYNPANPGIFNLTANQNTYPLSWYNWYIWHIGTPLSASFFNTTSISFPLNNGDIVGMYINNPAITSVYCRFQYEFCSPAYKILNSKATKIEILDGITVNPIPAYDKVYIKFNISEICKSKISITDITGRQVIGFEQELDGSDNQKSEIDIDRLPSGVYQIRICTDKKVYTEKMLK